MCPTTFQTIYSDLKADWQVFRKASRPCWPAEKTFATIKDTFSRFAWRGPVTLENFHNAGDHASLLSGLVKMRDLKPVAVYPVMAVSKFLHFYNPALFPIYDNIVIWDGVLRCFRNDFRHFCDTLHLNYPDPDSSSFLHTYIRWASSLVASAHSGFMETFVEWLRSQPGAELERHSFNAASLYATALEFTAIGAWCAETAPAGAIGAVGASGS